MALHHVLRKTRERILHLHGKLAALRKKHEAEQLPPPAPAARRSTPEVAQKVEVVFSSATVAKTLSIAILLGILTFFLYNIRDILVIFFVSLLFAAALDPMVDALERRRIPRSVAVILIYCAVFLALGLLISNVAPIVAKEISELASRVQEYLSRIAQGQIDLPQFLEKFRPLLTELFQGLDVSQAGSYRDILVKIANQLSNVAGNVFNGIFVIFNGFFNTIIVLVLTFLMTVDERGIDHFVRSLFPGRYTAYIQEKSRLIKEKMGYWLRGQIVLCFIVGLLVYIGLLIVGLFYKKVEYAATIALVAGFTELIPYAGPFIAWLVAMPIVANQSLGLIIWTTVLMYIVQVSENNLIVPMVMKRAVGLSSIFVMFAMFVGFEFLGVIGIVLAVPVATMVALFLKDYAEKEK